MQKLAHARCRLEVAFACLFLCCVAASPTYAKPITFDFTLPLYGPLAGTQVSGWVTYDDLNYLYDPVLYPDSHLMKVSALEMQIGTFQFDLADAAPGSTTMFADPRIDPNICCLGYTIDPARLAGTLGLSRFEFYVGGLFVYYQLLDTNAPNSSVLWEYRNPSSILVPRTPVPEAGTFSLAVVGLLLGACLVVYRERKRSAGALGSSHLV